MCQLTLADFNPKLNVVKPFIRSLLELNTLGINAGPNRDGFGYMLFDDKDNMVNSVDDAVEWWYKHNEKYQKEVKNGNGIYHVRLASGTSTTVYSKDAHPFKHDNIILAHNGTLHVKQMYKDDVKKVVEANMIDSEQFTMMLSKEVNNSVLTPEHIKQTYSKFYGVFAFLIHDLKNPDFVWIAKGSTKKLNSATFRVSKQSGKGKENVGILFNTGKWEIIYWSNMAKNYLIAMGYKNVEVDIAELDNEKIWKYKIGSYKLDKPVGNIIERNTDTYVSNFNHNHHNYDDDTNVLWTNRAKTATDKVPRDLAILSANLALSLKEVWIMSEIFSDNNVIFYDEKLMEEFYEFITLVKEKSFKGRIKQWERGLVEKGVDPIDIYTHGSLDFPYLLNSKSNLEKAFSNFKDK